MDARINTGDRIRNIALPVTGLCLVALVASTVYFAGRGFELSDEGFYLYFSLFPYDAGYLISHFGILNHMACLGAPTLFKLRIARIALYLGASAFFSWCACRWISERFGRVGKRDAILIWLTVMIAGFISYDYIPMTLSYNSWSLILSLIATGVIMLLQTRLRTRGVFLCGFIMGIVIYCLFVSKFPNAFVITGVLILVALVKGRVIICIPAAVMGFAAAWLLIAPSATSAVFRDAYATVFRSRHASVGGYVNDLYTIVQLAGGYVFLMTAVLCVLTVILVRKRGNGIKKIIFTSIAALALIFSIQLSKGNSMNLAGDFIVEFLFLVTAVAAFILFRPAGFKENGVIAGWILLLFLPLALMLGTNNPFYYTTSHYFCYWAFAGIVCLLPLRDTMPVLLPLFSILVCAFVSVALLNGMVRTPYRQDSLLAKSELLPQAAMGDISESPERFYDYQVLSGAFHKLKPERGAPMVFANYIGLAAMNGMAIRPASWISDSPASLEEMMNVVRMAGTAASELVVMPRATAKNAKFVVLFRELGIQSDRQYRLAFAYPMKSVADTVCFYVLRPRNAR